MPDLSQLGSQYTQHPDNKFGYCTPEYWEAEYRLWGISQKRYHETRESQAPKCPVCGVSQGYSLGGTGNCGCK